MSTHTTLRWWRAAQVLALVSAGFLVAGLWFAPDPTLRVLWGAIVPVLPALLLVHPALWRNVCPLASVNMVAARFGRRRAMSPRGTRTLNTLGVVLFAALVPLRGTLFDVDGQATATAILLFAGLAAIGGAFFDRKAGFCNAICPMLPIERLYGQAPAVRVSNPRCPTCTLCVRRGCIDLSGAKSVAQTLGPARRTAAWVREPFGAFAAAFPGGVLGFFLIPAGAPTFDAYGTVALGAAGSWIVTAAIVHHLAVPAARAAPVLAGVALLVFYWFTGIRVAQAWNGGPLVAWSVRGAAVAMGAVWYWRRRRRSPRAAGRPVRRSGPISFWGATGRPTLTEG